MPTYSHSRLATFEQCRQRYKLRYIDRITVPGQGIEAFMGSVVHDVLERLYQDVQHEKTPVLDELLALFQRTWDERWSDDIRIVRKEYSPQNYFNMGARFLRNYFKHHHPFSEGIILGLETQAYLDLGDGYRFHIRIDRLMDEGGGVYSVNDYKTSRSLPTQEELDDDRQLAIYSLWVHENFKDAESVKLVWHFLAHDRHRSSLRSLENLYSLREKIKESIGQIESCRSFEPNETPLCAWCDYLHLCPAKRHEARTEILSSKEFLEDEGVKLVNRLQELSESRERIEEEMVQVREDLIAYARQFDLTAVVGSGATARIVETETWEVPGKSTPEREELEDHLRRKGLYDDLAMLDIHALRRLDDETLTELGLERERRSQVRLGKR